MCVCSPVILSPASYCPTLCLIAFTTAIDLWLHIVSCGLNGYLNYIPVCVCVYVSACVHVWVWLPVFAFITLFLYVYCCSQIKVIDHLQTSRCRWLQTKINEKIWGNKWLRDEMKHKRKKQSWKQRKQCSTVLPQMVHEVWCVVSLFLKC